MFILRQLFILNKALQKLLRTACHFIFLTGPCGISR